MSANTTDNTDPLIRAQVYSEVILDVLDGGYLPEGLYRDISDFPDGTTYNIPTWGEVVLRDVVENQDMVADVVDTGNVTLTINKYKGAGSAFTDDLKEDSWKAAQFESQTPAKHLRAIKKAWETDLLNTSETMQTTGNPNTINGFAHRFVASGSSGILALADLIYAKMVLDKADVPDAGRILILDPICEGTFNSISNLVQVSNNPHFEGVITSGFAEGMKFLKNVYGFDIYLSNRLPHVVSENVDTSTITVAAPSGNGTSAADAVVCQAMCVLDEDTMPYMGAWRRMPRTEGRRNTVRNADEFYTTARWGFAGQRVESLVSILVSATAY